jgi:glutamate:GABA antiporter
VQSRPIENRFLDASVLRIPGGRPVAIGLAVLGLACTAVTVVLSAFPAGDDPHPVLAVTKILGLTAAMVGAGVLVFVAARVRQRGQARAPVPR